MLGKLLTRVGEDRVLWGTDGIWYGSPQPQIMAFRAFQISAELQERYGYPALTPADQGEVFGLNAAGCSASTPRRRAAPSTPADSPRPGRTFRRGARRRRDRATPWAARGPITRRQMLRLARHPGRHARSLLTVSAPGAGLPPARERLAVHRPTGPTLSAVAGLYSSRGYNEMGPAGSSGRCDGRPDRTRSRSGRRRRCPRARRCW